MLSEGFDMKIEKFTLLSLFFATLHTDNILHTLRGFLTYNAVSNTIIKTSKVMHAPNHSQWHLDPSHLSCRRCTNNTKIHKTYESYRVQYPRVTDSASDVECSCGCFHPCVGYDAVVFGVLYPVLIGFSAWVTSWVTDDLTLCSCEEHLPRKHAIETLLLGCCELFFLCYVQFYWPALVLVTPMPLWDILGCLIHLTSGKHFHCESGDFSGARDS